MISYVLQVFWGSGSEHADVGDWAFPENDSDTAFGLALWKPKSNVVMKWAVDYVTCSDERWIMFGPYETAEQARKAWESMRVSNHGFRILAEHCIKRFPNRVWTDG